MVKPDTQACAVTLQGGLHTMGIMHSVPES